MFTLSSVLKSSSLLMRGVRPFGESILKQRRERETQLAIKIKKQLNATYVSVTDTTIGTSSCGQMYNMLVESPMFEGQSLVKQHQMVSEVLKEEISNIHGFSLKTRIPKKNPSEKQPEKQK